MENTLQLPKDLWDDDDEKEDFYACMWHDAKQHMINDLISSGMTAEQAERIVSLDHPFNVEEYHIYYVNEYEIELCEEDYEMSSYRYDEYWDDIRILNNRGVDITPRILKEAKTCSSCELEPYSETKIIEKELIPKNELPVVIVKRYGYGYKATRSSYYIFTKEKTEPTYALNNNSAKERVNEHIHL